MVSTAVRACVDCQKWSSRRPVDAAQFQVPPSTPFWKLYLDCQGMPATARGGKFLIEARCGLTGFVEAAVLSSTKAIGATRFLREGIIYRYGVPNEVVVDGGSEFKKEFKTFCEQMGIKYTLASAYNPKANGIVENGHHSIASSLAKLTHGTGKNWRSYLPLALFADRTSVRASHGYTPFYLVYGYDPVTTLESKTPTWRILHWEDGMSQEALQDTRIRALEMRADDVSKAVAAVTRFREQRASDRDLANRFRRRAGGDQIRVGDMVLVWDSLRAIDMSYNTKLTYRWEGPFVVREEGSRGTYKLAQPDGAILARTFNRDLLRKVAKDDDNVWQDVDAKWWQEEKRVRSGGGQATVDDQQQPQTSDRITRSMTQPQPEASEEESSSDEDDESDDSEGEEERPLARRIREELEISILPLPDEYRRYPAYR